MSEDTPVTPPAEAPATQQEQHHDSHAAAVGGAAVHNTPPQPAHHAPEQHAAQPHPVEHHDAPQPTGPPAEIVPDSSWDKKPAEAGVEAVVAEQPAETGSAAEQPDEPSEPAREEYVANTEENQTPYDKLLALNPETEIPVGKFNQMATRYGEIIMNMESLEAEKLSIEAQVRGEVPGSDPEEQVPAEPVVETTPESAPVESAPEPAPVVAESPAEIAEALANDPAVQAAPAEGDGQKIESTTLSPAVTAPAPNEFSY